MEYRFLFEVKKRLKGISKIKIIFIFTIISYLFFYFKQVKKIKLFYDKSDEETQKIVQNCPILAKNDVGYFYPFFLAPTSNLQIIWLILRQYFSKIEFSEEETLILLDGGSVTLQWLHPLPLSAKNLHKNSHHNDNYKKLENKDELENTQPIMLIFHSLLGKGKDYAEILKRAKKEGWRGVVMNRRGHFEQLKTPIFNTIGDSNDAIAVIKHINNRFPHAEILLVGVSAGSGLLVRTLGDLSLLSIPIDNNNINLDVNNNSNDKIIDIIKKKLKLKYNVIGGVGISPGYLIDPNEPTSIWNQMNKFYERFCLSSLKTFFIHKNSELFSDRSSPLFGHTEKILKSKTISDFHLNIFPFTGYQSFEEYLEKSCPLKVANHILVPVLMINSTDDPICPIDCIQFDIYKKRLAVLVLTERGSHICFFNFGGFSSLSNDLIFQWAHSCLLHSSVS